MNQYRPEIFISATTSDLGSCREMIKQALLTSGYTPIEQTNFPPAAGLVSEILRKRIADCHAVIHVVGEIYGAEPQERSEDKPRRSYTQMEYDIACELNMAVHIFICTQEFPYDTHSVEREEQKNLQREHREKLLSLDRRYEIITSREQLENRIYALPILIEYLNKALKDKDNALEQARSMAGALAESYTRLQAESAGFKLTDAEIFNRAMTSVAQRAGISVAELESNVNLFVTVIRANPDASFMDQAVADFAEGKFAAAAKNAGMAGDEAQAKREAAEKLARLASDKVNIAKADERDARTLEGQARYADKHYAAAAQAFEKALAITPQSEHPRDWAVLQVNLGLSFKELASISTHDEIAKHIKKAINAFHAALTVLTREAMPQGWAKIQSNLALILHNQAWSIEGKARGPLLAEAAVASRAALEIFTRESNPQDWAIAQYILVLILHDQAWSTEGNARDPLLAEAAAASRAVLTVFTREVMPQDWARTQGTLALILHDQALATEGEARGPLLAEAAAASRAVLEVFTRETLPQDWARIQGNLALILHNQAWSIEGKARGPLLAEAAAAYRAVLKVFTRESLPQDWARTQNNLALILREQAQVAEGEARGPLLAEAVVAMKASLEIFAADIYSEWHAARISWISEIEVEIRQLATEIGKKRF